MKGNPYIVLVHNVTHVDMLGMYKSKRTAYNKAQNMSTYMGVVMVEKYNGTRKHYELAMFAEGRHTTTIKKFHSILGDV